VGVEIATIKSVSALFESRNGRWFIFNNATGLHLFRGEHLKGEHLKPAPRCQSVRTEVAAPPQGLAPCGRDVLGVELTYLIFKILLIC
jgi:hypothetical protein